MSKSNRLHMRISDETKERLHQIAEHEGVTMTSVVDLAIDNFISSWFHPPLTLREMHANVRTDTKRAQK